MVLANAYWSDFLGRKSYENGLHVLGMNQNNLNYQFIFLMRNLGLILERLQKINIKVNALR